MRKVRGRRTTRAAVLVAAGLVLVTGSVSYGITRQVEPSPMSSQAASGCATVDGVSLYTGCHPAYRTLTANWPRSNGVRIRVNAAGSIRGVRFFHAGPIPAAGVPVGLWDSAGKLVASGRVAAAAGRTTGWSAATFTPVSVIAGQRYVAGYLAADKRFVYSSRRDVTVMTGTKSLTFEGALRASNAGGLVMPSERSPRVDYLVDVLFTLSPTSGTPSTGTTTPTAPTTPTTPTPTTPTTPPTTPPSPSPTPTVSPTLGGPGPVPPSVSSSSPTLGGPGPVPPSGLRTLYVRGGCAAAGNGTTDTCGGANGAFTTLNQAYDASRPGDEIRVHAGTYDERLYYQHGGAAGRPVVWRTAGDGPVIWTNTGKSGNQKFVNDWTASVLHVQAGEPANHVTFAGSAGSEWVVKGGSTAFYNGAISINGTEDGANGTDWTFRHVKVLDHGGRAGTFTGYRLTFEDLTVSGNGSGFVFLASGGNVSKTSRPWSGNVVRRCTLTDNDSGGNDDGLIIQDIDGMLVEDCVVFGQYDGLDVGSQKSGAGIPGPRWIIERGNVVTGRNGVMPVSTIQAGPVSILYNSLYGNGNWGALPAYESSGNVHIWNNTFADNLRAVNFAGPHAGTLHFVNNLCAAGPNSKYCLDSNSGPVVKRTNYLAGVSHANPVDLGTGDVAGVASSVKFADASHAYPITASNPGLIDKGTFFLKAVGASSGTTIVTGASYAGGPSDPRTFFWPGDRITIEGVGIRTVTAVSATTLSLDSVASVPAGAGLHYAVHGSAPDIGRSEYIG